MKPRQVLFFLKQKKKKNLSANLCKVQFLMICLITKLIICLNRTDTQLANLMIPNPYIP